MSSNLFDEIDNDFIVAESKQIPRKYLSLNTKGLKPFIKFEDEEYQTAALAGKLVYASDCVLDTENSEDPKVKKFSKIPLLRVYCCCPNSKPNTETPSDMVRKEVRNVVSANQSTPPLTLECRFKKCSFKVNSQCLAILIKTGSLNLQKAVTSFPLLPYCSTCILKGAVTFSLSSNQKSYFYNKPVISCQCWANSFTKGKPKDKSNDSFYIPLCKSAPTFSQENRELYNYLNHGSNKQYFIYDNLLSAIEEKDENIEGFDLLACYQPKSKKNETNNSINKSKKKEESETESEEENQDGEEVEDSPKPKKVKK